MCDEEANGSSQRKRGKMASIPPLPIHRVNVLQLQCSTVPDLPTNASAVSG
jgi:hypothetical protein